MLDEQDRSLWNREQIREGRGAGGARVVGTVRPYTLQAAIAAVHAERRTRASTDWGQIVAHGLLLAGGAVADHRAQSGGRRRDARRAGGGTGTGRRVDDIGELSDYHLAHSARADLLRRLGETAAREPPMTGPCRWGAQEPERRFLQRRLNELHGTLSLTC